MRTTTLLRIGALLILVGVLIALGLSLDPAAFLDRDDIRQRVEENLWTGIGLFILLAVVAKLLFIPVSPFSLLAGYLFGGLLGGIIALSALTLASLVPFWLARHLGAGFVRETIEIRSDRLKRYNDLVHRRGFMAVLFLRLVPTLPMTAVNLLFGLTRVRVRDFMVGTLLGLAPGIFLLAYIGHYADDYTNPLLYVFAGLFVLMVFTAAIIGYRMREKP